MTPREALRDIFARDGLRPAVAYINSLVGHRFTAVLTFDAGMLKCQCFYDRDQPAADRFEAIPVEASYCVFVRDTGRSVAIGDSLTDPRTDGHPKRATIRAYYGYPLLDEDGRVFGSMCHFDVVPRRSDPDPHDLMEVMAELLHERRRAG